VIGEEDIFRYSTNEVFRFWINDDNDDANSEDYGDDYPGYRPPSPYSLNSTITRNSGGGGTSFYIPTMSVNIVSSYSSSYYYYTQPSHKDTVILYQL